MNYNSCLKFFLHFFKGIWETFQKIENSRGLENLSKRKISLLQELGSQSVEFRIRLVGEKSIHKLTEDKRIFSGKLRNSDNDDKLSCERQMNEGWMRRELKKFPSFFSILMEREEEEGRKRLWMVTR